MQRRTFLTACGAALAAGRTAIAEVQHDEQPYRVVDTHFHLLNSRIMGTEGVPKIGYLTLDATVEGAIEAMDRGGIDKAFLITYNAQDIWQQLVRYKVDLPGAALVYNNKYQKAAWKKHPDRFWWFPDHIDPTREGYLEDLQRDFEEGASGIKLITVFHGYWPDHPGFMPVYEMCRKHKKPIVMDISYWYLDFMPPINELEGRRNRVKRWSDYGKILAPIFKQYADVPISLAHTGTARRESDFDEILPFIAEFPNVSCDIAASLDWIGNNYPAFLQRLVKAVGSHKIMYGTDWPYWAEGKDSYLKGRYRIKLITQECPSFTEEDKRRILAENAERFVRFEIPQATTKQA